MTRAAPPSVFRPYDAEKTANDPAGQVVWCTRCPKLGRRTALVHKIDAIGRVRDRCPLCDGVAPSRPVRPDQVFRLQSLISEADLLPPCPPGVLRCQGCARPVQGDARLCSRCELPALRPPREPQPVSIVVGAAAAKVLRYLVAAIEAGELPASHVIGDALGMTSQNVDYHIAQLERKGYLARARAGKSRTIRVLLRDPVTTA